MMLQNERMSPRTEGKVVSNGWKHAQEVQSLPSENEKSDEAAVNLKFSTREVIGGASTFSLILSGRHAIDVLVVPVSNCVTLPCAISHIWRLTDLEFGGFLLFSSGLLGAMVALAWSLWPAGRILVYRGLRKWRKSTKTPINIKI